MIGSWRHACRFGLLALLLVGPPAQAGDSLVGKIEAVLRADVLVLNYGAGTYTVRLAGIAAPQEGLLAQRAGALVKRMVLDQPVRMRFEYRNERGEMVARVLTDNGKTDVGLELVKAGLARRSGEDYKYGELSRAQALARRAKRGLWSSP